MSERKRFIILMVLLAASIALLIIARTNVGEQFVKQLQ
jgi:hypothetical protein